MTPATKDRRCAPLMLARRPYRCERSSFMPQRWTKRHTIRAIQLASQWRAKAEPKNNEDRVWQLQGLAWAAKDRDAIKKAVRELLALQRSDGGWTGLPWKATPTRPGEPWSPSRPPDCRFPIPYT